MQPINTLCFLFIGRGGTVLSQTLDTDELMGAVLTVKIRLLALVEAHFHINALLA